MKRLIISIICFVALCSSATAQLSDKQQIKKLNAVYELIRDSYVDDVSLEPLVQEAIIATFKELDPHSKYLTKEEMESSKKRLHGEFAGIGISYIIHNDTLVVRSTMDNSPAQKADIRPNDRITAVNGQCIVGLSVDAISEHLKGEVGSNLTLRVERRGVDMPFCEELKREIIEQSAIGAAFRIGDVGYISVESFSKRVAGEFLNAYKSLGDINSLVVDLRDNGGGLITSSINLTSLFLNKGDVIVSTEGRGEPQVYIKKRDIKPIDIPLVVLINENSASASEIFAGAIQDHDRGKIVGHTSFGKGLVQRVIDLNDGSGIYLTIARYKTPAGRIIQRPYTAGEQGEYISDSLRFIHPDSISNKGRTTFKTLKRGREVYGDGGITPDEYIDISDIKISDSVIKSIEDRAAEHSVIDYVDSNSLEVIIERFPTMESFAEGYITNSKLLDIFYALAGYKADDITETDRAYINTMLLSTLAEQLYGDNARQYIYVSQFDPMARRAISIAKQEIME